jgi:hypothetical protein
MGVAAELAGGGQRVADAARVGPSQGQTRLAPPPSSIVERPRKIGEERWQLPGRLCYNPYFSRDTPRTPGTPRFALGEGMRL